MPQDQHQLQVMCSASKMPSGDMQVVVTISGVPITRAQRLIDGLHGPVQKAVMNALAGLSPESERTVRLPPTPVGRQ